MRVLIFDDKINGHHLEYVHHIHDMCLAYPENQFIFVLPESFNQVKDKFVWTDASNIIFDYLSLEQTDIQEGSIINSVVKSFIISKLVNRVSHKYKADSVFMISIMPLVPASLFLIKKRIKISGIIYQIYLYRNKQSSIIVKVLDKLKYWLLSKSSLFDTLFILNDKNSVSELNTIYSTHKFKYLPDPFLYIVPENIDIRKEYNIPDYHKLLIHIGALEERKGTLTILKSILDLSKEEAEKYTFFFAGRINQSLHNQFYDLVNQVKEVRVIVKDEFCSYGFFASLCLSADAILMPYILDSVSSGIIGYASQFNVPVIATSSGLVGRLVEKYQLGYLLPDNDTDNLKLAYGFISQGLIPPPSSDYCHSHSKSDFINAVSSILSSSR